MKRIVCLFIFAVVRLLFSLPTFDDAVVLNVHCTSFKTFENTLEVFGKYVSNARLFLSALHNICF